MNHLSTLVERGFVIEMYLVHPSTVAYMATYGIHSHKPVVFVEKDLSLLLDECFLFLDGIQE